MSSPHVFVYPAFLHINSTLTYSVYVRLDWDLQTPFPMLFQPQLPGGVCMGVLEERGGKKGRRLFKNSGVLILGYEVPTTTRIHILFLFCILILQVFDIVLSLQV